MTMAERIQSRAVPIKAAQAAILSWYGWSARSIAEYQDTSIPTIYNRINKGVELIGIPDNLCSGIVKLHKNIAICLERMDEIITLPITESTDPRVVGNMLKAINMVFDRTLDHMLRLKEQEAAHAPVVMPGTTTNATEAIDALCASADRLRTTIKEQEAHTAIDADCEVIDEAVIVEAGASHVELEALNVDQCNKDDNQ